MKTITFTNGCELTVLTRICFLHSAEGFLFYKGTEEECMTYATQMLRFQVSR